MQFIRVYFLLLISLPLSATPLVEDTLIQKQSKKSKLTEKIKHYTAHLTTAYVLNAFYLLGLRNNTYFNLGDIVAPTTNLSFPLIMIVDLADGRIIRFIYTALLLSLVYDTPEFTDKYILQRKHERTSQQKRSTFLYRCIPWPAGVILSEYKYYSDEIESNLTLSDV